jgi:hypothetical protein
MDIYISVQLDTGKIWYIQILKADTSGQNDIIIRNCLFGPAVEKL